MFLNILRINIPKNYANTILTINFKNTAISSQTHFRNVLKQNYLGHIKKGHL